MRARMLLVLGATALGALSSAAGAEDLPLRDSEVELAGYADCVVGRKSFRAPVETFLRTVPDSPAFHEAAMRAADMTCLNTAAMRRRASTLTMRLQPATFRDALYPALYRRDFGKKGPPTGIAAAPAAVVSAEFSGDTANLSPTYWAGREMGDCVARAAPQQVHAFLVTRPYSPQEEAASRALNPLIGGCLPAGQTIRFSRTLLRSFLGEAMYKLASAAGNAD
jgi:hypothetical protein